MGRRGFTLVEVLVVGAVVGILLNFSLLGFRSFSHQLVLSAAVDKLICQIRKTQAQALAQHKIIKVKIELPRGIKLVKSCNIGFTGSGFTCFGGSGSIILQNRLGRQRKIIVSTVGRVRVE